MSTSLSEHPINGGFPQTPPREAERIVHPFHPACGHAGTVGVPASLPPSIVRRVRCGHCGERFDRDPELDAAAPELREAARPRRSRGLPPLPRFSLPANPSDRFRAGASAIAGGRDFNLTESRLWAWLSVPLAALAVLVGVIVISGSDGEPSPPPELDGAALSNPGQAKEIERPTFSLSLPASWERAPRPDNAAFAAVSADGLGDATLWINENPKLSFNQFERRSLAQIEAITGSAEITDRVDGPSRETKIVEIRGGNEASSSPAYRVTLRASGNLFYYLATSIAPGADPKLSGDAEIIHTSLLPAIPAG